MALLNIEPQEEVHFWLTEDTPECSVVLKSNPSSSGPIVYRVQPSRRHRYAVYPSYGVVQPEGSTPVHIVLLEHAKTDLQSSFQRQGPLAEFRQMDKIVIEWCRAPDSLYNQLCGEEDQDLEVLSSFWNTNGYDFGAPVISSKKSLRVRFSVDEEHASQVPAILPSVSMDGSSSQDEDSLNVSREHIAPQSPPLPNNTSNYSAIRQSYSLDEHPDSYDGAPTSSLDERGTDGTIHKFQLRQTLRCGQCYQVFSKQPSEETLPIMSQSCCHTICRGCVLNRAQRFGTMDVSCPLCQSPHAFGGGTFHVNHSLLDVIGLLDTF